MRECGAAAMHMTGKHGVRFPCSVDPGTMHALWLKRPSSAPAECIGAPSSRLWPGSPGADAGVRTCEFCVYCENCTLSIVGSVSFMGAVSFVSSVSAVVIGSIVSIVGSVNTGSALSIVNIVRAVNLGLLKGVPGGCEKAVRWLSRL